MKYSLVFLSVFYFFPGYGQNTILHNLVSDGLRGKVKTSKETFFQTETDKNKNVFHKTLRHRLIDVYDKQGKLLSITDSLFDDETGATKIEYQYNNSGQIVEARSYYADGTPWDKTVYQFNSDHELIKIDWYNNARNAPDNTTKWVYNNNHNVVETDNYSNSKLAQKQVIKYQYNQAGLPVSICSGSGDLIDSLVLRYDKRGRKIQTIDFRLGDTTTTYYDNGGRVIKTVEVFANTGVTETLEYAYRNFDKKGNWLFKSSIKNHYPIEIIARQITYYP